jgi:hypothetical protein
VRPARRPPPLNPSPRRPPAAQRAPCPPPSWSRQLRSRPAALSECRAIYAPDPTNLAQLALKDAERVASLKPTWHKGYSRQGAALFMLERYGEAETAYLEGLMLSPDNASLQEGLAKARGVV